ncbi:protein DETOXIFICATION 45, chloroplastic [Salvia miltiorrhiza]|uniref:protein DETOXIFICATION 45, chloroplastic n=1 Tax=Salvia miltiorrhiza TaxID=226208 RepID=UPI0025AC07CA|nr:protein DETOXIFICATION 45, chloroplastic [Salvia miltiorrhiza]XP_057769134.1 protein DETOXIFICATION 45, chloroplastic [Salvia miltiorrhiza]XP_057769135.1 protein DETOXIFICATION 45, chloroplastic [Salvia miltiorrhiza]XP_057769137.1 protein DETOXIFICATION 45, chloroplastic [Salvia miltiorrhiza]
MAAAQLAGGTAVSCESNRLCSLAPNYKGFRCLLGKRRSFDGGRAAALPLCLDRAKLLLPCPIIRQRKTAVFPRLNCQLSPDCSVESDDVEDTVALKQESQNGGPNKLNGAVSSQISEIGGESAAPSDNRANNVRRELVMLSLPAIGGQAIDPIVQLLETAYIGRLGAVELGSAGVSISLFNIISKLFNIPLLSVATSFVAEDIAKNASKPSTSVAKMQLSSVSTALFLAVGIGIFEATALVLGSGPLLSLMGISPASPMRAPAQRFLILRALGAPAFVVSLALQGIFRGFKDTTTPVYCLGFGNFTAIFLFPLFMYYFRLGVNGAAISTVISQYIVTFSMIWNLNKRAVLLPPKLGELQFGNYLKSGGFLIGRTLAVLLTMTLGTSMAARLGPVAMSAHQICSQVWLAVSLLTDAFGAAAQALVASYISKKDYANVKDVTQFVLKIGLVTGVSLAVILGFSFSSLAPIFTKDVEVLRVVRTGVLFVCASQPINALAFIFDGLYYGVSDFRFAAISMMLSGAISSMVLLYAPRAVGLPGVWFGLTLLMALRTAAGFIRLSQRSGPWWFLHTDLNKVKLV